MSDSVEKSVTPPPENFSILFMKVASPEHQDIVKASEEIARTTENIRFLSEAIVEINQPAFTTYISA